MTPVGVLIARRCSPHDAIHQEVLFNHRHGFFYTPEEMSTPFFSQERARNVLQAFARRHDIPISRLERLHEEIPRFPLPAALSEYDNHYVNMQELQPVFAMATNGQRSPMVGIYEVRYMLINE